MITLLKKELNSFFNHLLAYVILAVFLTITGLFLWVFPGAYNIPENGYANLDGLFQLAPYVFLFLVPAITMRFFAEERKAGTIEWLLTKPLSDNSIILSKYLAALMLLVMALLPTLIYFLTLRHFALPPGVDTGGMWGSYLGLFFLGSVFVAIGLFASSLTENQVVAFILALFLCGFAFIGFELAYSLALFTHMDLFIRNLGLQAHYVSMSRGVIDSRDLIYFLSLIALFLSLTKIKLGARKYTGFNRKPLLAFLSVIAFILAINLIGSLRFVRLDLTSERRYTLTEATRDMLRELDDIVYFRVYLEGDFPAGFRKLRNETREMLDEFRAYSEHIHYEFINPAGTGDRKQVQRYQDMLIDKGLQPAQIQIRSDDASTQQLIFPGALLSYRGREVPLQLLQDQVGLSTDEVLHYSAQALEYKLASSIYSLTRRQKERIAFLHSHQTLDAAHLADISASLSQLYELEFASLDDGLDQLSDYKAIMVAKPRQAFSEKEKLIMDQYLMQGGNMLWLIDPVFAEMDSLAQSPETVGLAWPLNLDDFFFNYGLRLNADLLQDLNAAPLPVTTGFVGSRPQISLLSWYFFPLLRPASDHPVVRNLNLVRTEFVSSLDTAETAGVVKTPLLSTSAYSRSLQVPVRISLDILRQAPDEKAFAGPPRTAAMLLEGGFRSLFTNRLIPEDVLPTGYAPRETSEDAAIIVIADGDVIRNQFGGNGQVLPLGYDRYSGETFGNKEFILNAVNYLADDSGLIQARARDIRLRMLNKSLMNQQKSGVQIMNLFLPLLLVAALGMCNLFIRRRRFSR
jgi:ABC-2 type transport system permease protein